jgi:broad specificity phosphatase PhoE
VNLFLIRHQKTQWNMDGRLQGRDNSQDILLDDPFSQDVKDNLVLLNSINFNVVVSSPQKRARQTAEAYGYTDYLVEDAVMEYDFGVWEGCFKNELLEKNNNFWLDRFTQFPDGEAFDSFSYRLDSFIDTYKKYQNVLVFTHGVVCRYLVCKVNGFDLNRINHLDFSNNKIFTLEV